jgi:TP901 family phage tail tape measure protein
MADAKLEIILQAKDQTKGAFSSVKSELSGLGTATQKAGSSLSSMSKVMTGVAVAGAAALATGFVAVVKSASNFEQQMSAVGAASQASASEMGQLHGLALDLGKDLQLSGVGATEAAQAMEELAKGGVSVGDQIGGATKGALLLFSAGANSVAEATGIAVKAMNIFGLAGSDVAHVSDLLAAGANKSATDVSALGQAFNQSAAVAKNAGLSIEELTGTLSFLAQRGIEGSDAGTSLKTALLALQAPTDVAAATMKELGINVRDANGDMLPFAEIAQVLQGQARRAFRRTTRCRAQNHLRQRRDPRRYCAV